MVQKSLRDRGYYSGPLDNIMGPQTKKALVQFQKDKGILLGMNMDVLEALGLR